jgi:hypothetical protein
MERRADMRAFYTGMRALLNGDTTTLFELFVATTVVDGDHWTIELVPISADLQAFLERLTVTGRGSQVLTFLTAQPGGDSQELSFTAAGD